MHATIVSAIELLRASGLSGSIVSTEIHASFHRSLARLEAFKRADSGISYGTPVDSDGVTTPFHTIVVHNSYISDVTATADVLIHEGYHASDPTDHNLTEEEFYCHAVEAVFANSLSSPITAMPLATNLNLVRAAFQDLQLVDFVLARHTGGSVTFARLVCTTNSLFGGIDRRMPRSLALLLPRFVNSEPAQWHAGDQRITQGMAAGILRGISQIRAMFTAGAQVQLHDQVQALATRYPTVAEFRTLGAQLPH